MNKKRGMIWVVLVLIIIISSLVRSVDLQQAVSAVGVKIEVDDEIHCREDENIPGDRGQIWMINSLDYCPSETGEAQNGCPLESLHTHRTADRDEELYRCTWIDPGAILTRSFQKNFFKDKFAGGNNLGNEGAGDKDRDNLGVHCANVKSPDDAEYLCSDSYDTYAWARCNIENIGKIALAAGYAYQCKSQEGLTIWVEADKDHDGYIDGDEDCNYDLSYNPNGVICPSIDPKQIAGKTLLEVRFNARAICGNPRFAQCAVCVNPGTVEVCGDQTNNDCGGASGPNENWNQLEGRTSNECNKNQFACTQTSPSPDQPAQDNIYGEQFSWMKDKDGNGYCCGYNQKRGIDIDNGKILADKDNQQHLCLNKNLISGYDTISQSGWGDGSTTCQGDWCWVNSIGAAAFRIITLNQLDGSTQDVVSNDEYWIKCNQGEDWKTPLENTVIDIKNANRYYCYKEGKRWSWAECKDPYFPTPSNNIPIKSRNPGDGLFSLNTDQTDSRVVIDFDSTRQEYYKKSFLDVSGYDNLEFEIQFIPPEGGVFHIPADARIVIYGPPKKENGQTIEEKIYLDQSVLASATNNPTIQEGKWFHIKIPFSKFVSSSTEDKGLYGISSIVITSKPIINVIHVNNFYFSTDISPICSGDTSPLSKESAWLTDIDQGTYGSTISGKKICDRYYAKGDIKAWLGLTTSSNMDTPPNYRCCGDDVNEYYSGQSSSNNGCWNSEVFANGDTMMNVEVKVTSKNITRIITYPPETVTVTKTETLPHQIEQSAQYKCPTLTRGSSTMCSGSYGDPLLSYTDCTISSSTCSGQVNDNPTTCDVQRTEYSCRKQQPNDNSCTKNPAAITTSWTENCDDVTIPQGWSSTYTTIADVSQLDWSHDKSITYFVISTNKFYKLEYRSIPSTLLPTQISLTTSPQIIGDPITKTVSDLRPLVGNVEGSITISDDKDNVNTYFYDPLIGSPDSTKTTLTADDFGTAPTTYYIMAEVNQNYLNSITSEPLETPSPEQSLTFTCSPNSVCTYPLPGEPPYTITNPHPDLYDLYFVEIVDGQKKTTLITPTNNLFTNFGNIEAKRVPQQVVFIRNGTEAKSGFFGCNAPTYINRVGDHLTQFSSCGIRGEYFCAPSIYHDSLTTINEWNNIPVTQVGYDMVEGTQYTQPPLKAPANLDPTKLTAERRSHLTPAVPARNIIPNAEFNSDNNKIFYWTIYKDGVAITNVNEHNLRQDADGSVVELLAGETFLSEKIAVPSRTNLSFSQNLTCNPTLFKINNEGVKTLIPITKLKNFNTTDASSVQLQFTGPCRIKWPMLQVVDQFQPIDYYYNDYKERAGLSCCPNSYCWNGFTCVAPMETSTFITEQVSGGREYRCIDGEWSYLPPKSNWNGDKMGLCSASDQCFVLSSSNENTNVNLAARDFGEEPTPPGPLQFPACIKNGEFILDHYCEQGNWTSRTKYLASSLLNVTGNGDHTIYCTNFDTALLDKDKGNVINILWGKEDLIAAPAPTNDLLRSTTTPSTQPKVCFDGISAVKSTQDGPSLIPENENTCINNVCVITYDDGKVAFATTLNQNISGINSFLQTFEIDQGAISSKTLCTEGSGFQNCDLQGRDTGKLYYSQDLNAVIYSKESLTFTRGFTEEVIDWFRGLFGIETPLSREQAFLAQAQDYRDLYLLQQGDKKVRALNEITPIKRTLIAEYEGFDTPVCEYIDADKINNPDFKVQLLNRAEQPIGRQFLRCTVDENNIQRVEAIASENPLKIIWPQLTGKLRVS